MNFKNNSTENAATKESVAKSSINVALLGYGTVGSAVCEALLDNAAIIKARCGKDIKPVTALARTPKQDARIPVTTNVAEILARDDIDIFVEVMGGIDAPFEVVRQILAKNKPVITANKAMLAYHRYDLQEQAKNTFFGYEASVAGGIPIIQILKDGLSANNIISIKAILNGTSNYILSSMSSGGTSFDAALKTAQDLGYAEADPTFDIEGIDSAHKLLILSSLAFGLKNKPEDILIEGITKISAEDMYFAKEFEYEIKLLGIAKANSGKVELRVHCAMIDKNKMLAKINGVMNGVSIIGDLLGESVYYGAGAGGKATASAVISDLMRCAKATSQSAMLGFEKPLSYTLVPKDEIYTKYYLRLKVEDKIGVLSKITQLMSENAISIDSFLQKPKANEPHSTLFFTTHHTFEKHIQGFLRVVAKQEFIKAEPFMMRIEN